MSFVQDMAFIKVFRHISLRIALQSRHPQSPSIVAIHNLLSTHGWLPVGIAGGTAGGIAGGIVGGIVGVLAGILVGEPSRLAFKAFIFGIGSRDVHGCRLASKVS